MADDRSWAAKIADCTRVGTTRRSLVRAALCALLVAPGLSRPAGPDDAVWDALEHGSQVILLRHAATTPGVGDPPGFKLDDCSTQRNLADEGRAQALALGEALRAHRIPIERVVSSPWCRCIETARLAFDTTPEKSPALSNLFGKPENRDPQLVELRKLVSGFRGKGNLVLVSHGSTISALTGVMPEQGEMVVVKPEGSGNFSVVGRLNVRQP
jgi:phosphohistidine phosphatase SixA